ncbi:MAG: helix-turn-helix transcriptional regulator [Acidobacteriota bacterium]|nr:helix-turn-helix transcriptional regulator [Acidobacteriota bacterium]
MGSHLVVLTGRRSVPEYRFSRGLFRGEPMGEAEELYVKEYGFRDERLPRLRDLPNARLVHNRRIYTEQEQRTSPVYCSFLPRVGSNNQLNVRLDGLHDTDIVWALTKAAGLDWTSEQVAFLERLLPHAAHFVRVRQALAVADARDASLTELMGTIGLGAVLLDQRARVLEVNTHGRRLLATGRCLRERSGRLRARWRSDDAKLGRLLASCCREGVGGSMTIRPSCDDSIAGPVVLHASPVPSDLTNWDTRGVAARVLLTEPHSVGPIDPAPIAVTYDLTETESRVAALLAEGAAVSEIAATTGRKESTVRWHVRNLHSKLGVHRQADLVRLVLSTAVAAPAEQ